MEHWWINGLACRAIDVTDRGFTYADGLFETIAIRAGQARFLALHLDRLLAGCFRLGIAAPVRTTLELNLGLAAGSIRDGVLKVIVTSGPGPRGYRRPEPAATTVAWGTEETEPRPAVPIRVRWCETMTSPNPATAGLKALGRLEQVLARAEWTEPEVAEGLMISTEGHLIGGTASNVFLVAGDRVLTPSLHRSGIAGIMRRVVMESAKRSGITIVEAQLNPSEVTGAAEIFMTNALTGIRPVRQLGGQTWGTGPITQRLRQLLAAAGVGECAGES